MYATDSKGLITMNNHEAPMQARIRIMIHYYYNVLKQTSTI